MARLLLLAFIIFLAYLAVRAIFRSRAARDQPSVPPAAHAEDMVECTRCGVNLPRSSAKQVDGKLVCDGNPNCR